tara:strand:+ start:123 stop:869 length:747 start_codon:yes stop_codon:yes gene_type:complete
MAMFVSGSSSSTGSLARLELYSSAAVGSNVLTVDGTQGRLFSVIDEMSGSIFSANTIAGLPVIEAFSNNEVNLGPYSSPVHIDSSGNISGSANSTGSFGKVSVGTSSNLLSELTVEQGSSKRVHFGLVDGNAGIYATNVANSSDTLRIKGYRVDIGHTAGDFYLSQAGVATFARAKVTLSSTLVSGSSTSTGSFGKLETSGDVQTGGTFMASDGSVGLTTTKEYETEDDYHLVTLKDGLITGWDISAK